MFFQNMKSVLVRALALNFSITKGKQQHGLLSVLFIPLRISWPILIYSSPTSLVYSWEHARDNDNSVTLTEVVLYICLLLGSSNYKWNFFSEESFPSKLKKHIAFFQMFSFQNIFLFKIFSHIFAFVSALVLYGVSFWVVKGFLLKF